MAGLAVRTILYLMAKRRTSETIERAPDGADAAAFRAAVRDVKPLAAVATPTGLVKPPVRRRRRVQKAPDELLDLTMPVVDPQSLTGADPLNFQRPGVRPQVMRRLRRGLFPIEDELDLHGLSQAAARDHVVEFLRFNRDGGRRCVRIIHGKGYRSGTRGPLLKIAVDFWLRRHPDVMGFTSARPIDGGTGAVYVLLRA